MISVVIPLYNKEKQITRTLQTVLNQTYKNFEIIIVNDGSTDNSVEEVKKFVDNRIHLINQKNEGVSAARNRGIEEAKGEFLAFLDADDEWCSDYLQMQFHLTKQYPECDVFATNYEFREPNGEIRFPVLKKIPFKNETGILSNYFEVASHSHPPFCSISVMVRKSILEIIGGFPIGIKSGEDLLTWAKLASQYKIAYCMKSCAVYNLDFGHDIKSRPTRIPAENDVVGNELDKLWLHYHQKGMKEYISLWHKMRSSCFMRLNMRRKSIKEAYVGLRYNPFNFKLYIYILINFLPAFIRTYK